MKRPAWKAGGTPTYEALQGWLESARWTEVVMELVSRRQATEGLKSTVMVGTDSGSSGLPERIRRSRRGHRNQAEVGSTESFQILGRNARKEIKQAYRLPGEAMPAGDQGHAVHVGAEELPGQSPLHAANLKGKMLVILTKDEERQHHRTARKRLTSPLRQLLAQTELNQL